MAFEKHSIFAKKYFFAVNVGHVVNSNSKGKAHNVPHLSTDLYASVLFWTKDTAEPRRLHRPLQCWFSIILRPKEVVFHDLHFLLLPSPLRNGRKREGHPCMQKGINMIVSTL